MTAVIFDGAKIAKLVRADCRTRVSRLLQHSGVRPGLAVVNVGDIAELFPQGGRIDVDQLVAAGAVRKGKPVKVLGNGDVAGVKLDITADAFSGSAVEKINAAGGSTATR